MSRTNPGGLDSEGLGRFIETELRPGLPPETEIAPAQFIDLTVIEEAQRELGVRGS